MKKTALITGASAPIGQEVAFLLAEEGYNLVLTALRPQNIRNLKIRLEQTFKDIEVLALSFDLRDRAQCEAILSGLPEEYRQIDLLINNASVSFEQDKINLGEPLDSDAMIDTNIKGMLNISRIISGQMIAQGSGHIITVSSEVIQGHKGSVYFASKYAARALSEGMREDLKGHGIKVSEIRHFSPSSIEAVDVAEAILWATEQPDHVNVNLIELAPSK